MVHLTIYSMSDLYKLADEYVRKRNPDAQVEFIEIGVEKGNTNPSLHVAFNVDKGTKNYKEYLTSFPLKFKEH